MKKVIDIPDDVYRKLKHLCIDKNTNAKNWIENLIIQEINKTKTDHITKK